MQAKIIFSIKTGVGGDQLYDTFQDTGVGKISTEQSHRIEANNQNKQVETSNFRHFHISKRPSTPVLHPHDVNQSLKYFHLGEFSIGS